MIPRPPCQIVRNYSFLSIIFVTSALQKHKEQGRLDCKRYSVSHLVAVRHAKPSIPEVHAMYISAAVWNKRDNKVLVTWNGARHDMMGKEGGEGKRRKEKKGEVEAEGERASGFLAAYFSSHGNNNISLRHLAWRMKRVESAQVRKNEQKLGKTVGKKAIRTGLPSATARQRRVHLMLG